MSGSWIFPQFLRGIVDKAIKDRTAQLENEGWNGGYNNGYKAGALEGCKMRKPYGHLSSLIAILF